MQFGMKVKRILPYAALLILTSPFVAIGFLSAFVVGSFKGGWEAYTIIIKRLPD